MKQYKILFLKYGSYYKGQIGILIGLVLANGYLATFPIKLIEKLINSSIQDATFQRVAMWGVIYLASQILWVVTGGGVSFATAKLETEMGHRIRCDMFYKIERLPISFFEREKAGDLMVSLTQDSSVLVGGILKPIVFLSLNVFQFIMGIYFISSISWEAVCIMIPVGFLLVLLSLKSGGKIQALSGKDRDATGVLWKFFSEGIQNVKLIKSLGKERDYFEKVDGGSQAVKETSFALERYNILIDRMYSSLFMFLIAFIMVYGSLQVKAGNLSIGGLSALMMYNGMLIDPMLNFSELYRQLQQILVSVHKIVDILEEGEEEYQIEKERKESFQREISIQELSFSYTERTVLKNISMKIKKGEHIVFVGLSGSGKSTLYDLLFGFYPVENGKIYIDGTDINQIPLNDLRNLFHVAFQKSYFFDGTIRENLEFSNSKADEEEMLSALEKAGLGHFMECAPQGLDTYIGKNGDNLSGGEKQRLALARVFLSHRPILILDEATSGLDSITALEIMKNIKDMYQNDTIICTVHKLQGAVEECNRIYMFENGKIVDSGTHKELLQSSQRYRELYYAATI